MDRLHYVVSVYTVLNASEHASTCHTNPTRTAKDALLQPRTSSGWKRHKQFCRSYSYYCSLMRCFLRIKKSFLETNRKNCFLTQLVHIVKVKQYQVINWQFVAPRTRLRMQLIRRLLVLCSVSHSSSFLADANIDAKYCTHYYIVIQAYK